MKTLISLILSLQTLAVAGELTLANSGHLRWTGQSSVVGTTQPQLQRGDVLVKSQGGLFGSSSVTLTGGPLRVAVRGESLVSHTPGAPTIVTCLAGTVDVYLSANSRVFTSIKEGQLIMVPAAATTLPAPALVRLSKLRATHPLLAQSSADGASSSSSQEKAIKKGKLFASGVQLQGTKATVAAGGTNSDGSSSANASSNSSSSGGGGSSSSGGGGSSSSGGGASVAVAAVGGGAACA